jgi:phosphoglycerate dehydrogenase-like enzyme
VTSKRKVKHRKQIRKQVRRRTSSSNSLTQTNRLIADSTRAVIGLGVLGATVNIASGLLKK